MRMLGWGSVDIALNVIHACSDTARYGSIPGVDVTHGTIPVSLMGSLILSRLSRCQREPVPRPSGRYECVCCMFPSSLLTYMWNETQYQYEGMHHLDII